MADRTSKASDLVYNPNQSPLSPNNRRYAKQQGWKFDPDFGQYRDRKKQGFLVTADGEVPDNDVDCLK